MEYHKITVGYVYYIELFERILLPLMLLCARSQSLLLSLPLSVSSSMFLFLLLNYANGNIYMSFHAFSFGEPKNENRTEREKKIEKKSGK